MFPTGVTISMFVFHIALGLFNHFYVSNTRPAGANSKATAGTPKERKMALKHRTAIFQQNTQKKYAKKNGYWGLDFGPLELNFVFILASWIQFQTSWIKF